MTNHEIKYFSTFTGIGGFELGIEGSYVDGGANAGEQEDSARDEGQGLFATSGQDVSATEGLASQRGDGEPRARPICVGFSEVDKYAVQIYQSHFPEHKNYGDITKIEAESLPDFDLLVGGFPCQAFSIAGKRGGFTDTRGTLFFDLARILAAKQPRLFLFENVKGLLSHDEGRTFSTIIATLDELGYDLDWQVLNSKDFGVPQNRERVYIAGHLRGEPRPKVFPFREDSEPTDELPRHVTNTITARYEGGATGSYVAQDKLDTQEIKQLNHPAHSNERVYDPEGISPTLNTMQGGQRQPFIRTENMNGDGFENDYAGTIRAGASRSNNLVNNIRRLTPMECERLQGFPDRWTEGVSDSQRYKTIGNAVTVNVIRAIMTKML